MVCQNIRSGGERQRGTIAALYINRLLNSVNFCRCERFLVEKKKSALCPWQNTDFFRITL